MNIDSFGFEYNHLTFQIKRTTRYSSPTPRIEPRPSWNSKNVDCTTKSAMAMVCKKEFGITVKITKEK